MKNIIIGFFSILSISQIYGQNTNRYYPSIKNILNDESEKKLPQSLNFFNNWIRTITYNFYYKDFQTSSSPREDAQFTSLSLILKKENKFNFGNSGIKIFFNENKENFSESIPLTFENQYKILAYFRSFNPDDFNPEKNKQLFEVALRVLNISEEQAMANFINIFVETDDSTAKNDKIKVLLSDLKKEAKINLNFKDLENLELKNIVQEIYKNTNKYSSSVLYDVYISDKNKVREEQNLRQYFRSYLSEDMPTFISDIISYQGSVNLVNKNISILFPKEIIQLVEKDKENNLEIPLDEEFKINPFAIEYKSIITKEKKGMEISFLIHNNEKTSEFFKAPNEIKLNSHPFLEDNKRTINTYEVDEIKKIVLFFSENKIEAFLKIENKSYNLNLNFMNQSFLLN